MVDFICTELLDLRGEQTKNYKMKNSCPQWDWTPGPSAYETNSQSVARLGHICSGQLIEQEPAGVLCTTLGQICD